MRKALPSTVAGHLPSAAVLLALAAAGLAPALAPRGILPLTAELPGWMLLAGLAALHRPFDRVAGDRRSAAADRTAGVGPWPTLGLGALALAPAVERLGAVPAVVAASGAFLLAEVSRGLVEGWTATGMGPRFGAALRRLAPSTAAALGASAVFAFAGRTTGAEPIDGLAALPALARQAVPPLAAYLLGFALVSWWTLRAKTVRTGGPRSGVPAFRGPRSGVPAFRGLRSGVPALRGLALRGPAYRPLALDAAGWVLGVLLADAARFLGWTRVGLLATAAALLAAEAARCAMLERAADYRAGRLERMQRAHARILGETSGVEEIAQQILAECRRVLPVQWFQLELVAAEEPEAADAVAQSRTSWTAGPEVGLHQGRPRPAERPRTLPGIHRRVDWRILEHPLEAEDETLAVVRLWCDPRRIKPGAEELFAALVPQMTAAVLRTRLERQARLDPLTGIPLRRPFESGLERFFRRSCAEGRPMAVVMCDIDFFKRINDTYGHAAGDQALVFVARTLDAQRRENDLCCRYGGEEFVLLFEGTGGARALRLAERLRRAIESLDLVFEERSLPLTLSAGVAAFPELHVKTASELLLLADEALYEAKEQGRNRSLLNLGRGRFRTPEGGLVGDLSPAEGRLPRIFG